MKLGKKLDSAKQIKVVPDAQSELALISSGQKNNFPKVILFRLSLENMAAGKELKKICYRQGISLVAIMARSHLVKKRLELESFARSMIGDGTGERNGGKLVGLFYDDCHHNPFCLDELVRRIREAINR